MASPVNDVCLAVVIDVVNANREPGLTQIPFALPLPLVSIGVNVFEPAVRCKNVDFSVAIDIRHADSVAVFVVPADVMDLRLRSGEVDPEDAGPAVMSQGQIRLAFTIDIGHPATLGLDR